MSARGIASEVAAPNKRFRFTSPERTHFNRSRVEVAIVGMGGEHYRLRAGKNLGPAVCDIILPEFCYALLRPAVGGYSNKCAVPTHGGNDGTVLAPTATHRIGGVAKDHHAASGYGRFL